MRERSDVLFAEVDASDNTTTVYSGACRLWGVWVTTVLSAHALPFYDGSGGTNILNLAASADITTFRDLHGIRCPNGIYVDPNDSATGKVIVAYEPYHDGLAG